ncbi:MULTISPECIES: hypothetical protein [unclassified Tolypothrix]|uniref:hypothetical protein n=1 Tax=unclassified Tolypothrix TaxID=2649714 RepID=UPI0005EAC5B4|nr:MULTISPECIES: hypothetical protein [unclassified Tolypothrix]BAY94156.1 hypothetical protein NIES3275_62010 [Microchaete diplosiphon NIES-3275]EKF03779.1 hypothetical protein FDUTEX481_02188 [Tolypothrix sp. PCC 7601]MBE9084953.1 hypothetical protein [Tolypothrix sp. LEGE 11397]UYD27908.1 hypothetical protein HGR01_07610 [Tolypothrix sp. PCC 7712]UYD36224.1 hypothetical protein HG267_11045 [Tolypothrix sp. PCC 7601]
MIAQVQPVIPAPVDSKVVKKSEFEQYAQEKANALKNASGEGFSLLSLADVTKTILHHAFWLAEQKQQLSLRQYKQLLVEQGWKGEEKKYLKIAAVFGEFSPQDLAQIEPLTVYQLANNNNKYKPVIDALLELRAITQEAVRSLVKEKRTPREPKPEKPSIWRRTKNGGRYCQIPSIHEEDEHTGVTLQNMIDTEGLSAQQIVAEAIALRKAYKEGLLVVVEENKN